LVEISQRSAAAAAAPPPLPAPLLGTVAVPVVDVGNAFRDFQKQRPQTTEADEKHRIIFGKGLPVHF
jgi:hypothetical protein